MHKTHSTTLLYSPLCKILLSMNIQIGGYQKLNSYTTAYFSINSFIKTKYEMAPKIAEKIEIAFSRVPEV